MNRQLFLIVFLFVLRLSVFGAGSDVAQQAAEAYADKDYVAAEKFYQQLIDEGVESAGLYYNLGNTYYHLGRLGPAICCYEKALKRSPADEAIRHNLQLAYSHTLDSIPKKRLPDMTWQDKTIRRVGEAGWSWVGLGAVALALLLYAIVILRPERKKSKWLAHFLLIITVTSFILAIQEKNRLEDDRFAIILAPEVPVISKVQQPAPAKRMTLHEGTKVEIVNRRFGWCQVRFGNETGWVPEDVLGVI